MKHKLLSVLLVLALLTAIFIVWVVGVETVVDEVKLSSRFKKEKLFRFIIKYIVPVSMVIILVSSILEEYNIGLTLVDVKIQDSEPPTQEVIEAFKAVETAKQQAETVVNDAKAYQNAKLPDAQAQADKLIQNAEYLKQKRINEALEQVAMFTAMYEEYAKNPQITKSRMYYEAIQEILPGVKLYINTASGGDDVQMLLPLESLVDTANGGGN